MSIFQSKIATMDKVSVFYLKIKMNILEWRCFYFRWKVETRKKYFIGEYASLGVKDYFIF